MATTNTWDQVVSKITGVVNRGTLNWSGSNTTYVLSSGYYTGGTLDSRPSYTNGYNTGVSAADNRVNTSSASYSSGYNNGYSAGNTAGYNNGYNAGVNAGTTEKRNNVTLQKIGPTDDDVTIQNYTFGASNGRCYIAAMAGDPGNFQNFNISGATLLSNIYAGDTPPQGRQFVRMISFRATSGSVTIRWTGGTGSTQPYMICALVN